MPRKLPPFFRYSYIIHGDGYLKGKHIYYSAHGILFTFHRPDEGRKAQLRSETWTLFIQRKPTVGKATFEIGEEIEEVTHEESRGIGFYWAHFLWNDKFYYKGDYR